MNLTEDQQEILSLLQQNKTPEEISRVLNKPLGVINAQCTRMRNKFSAENLVLPIPRSKPSQVGPSSNSAVIDDVEKSGQAVYNVEEVIKEVQKSAGDKLSVRDIHPMVLLGLTIQFMKLAGGRLHAHQLIEDVYGALRMLVDGQKIDEVPGVTTQTQPFNSSPSDDQSIISSLNRAVFEQSKKQQEIMEMLKELKYSAD